MFPIKTSKLAEYHLLAGSLIFLFSGLIKQALPGIGLLPLVQFPCAFLSSVLLPVGTFLSLYVFVCHPEERPKSYINFCAGVFIILMVLAYFAFTYVILTKTLALIHSVPTILPKLIENARVLPKEEQRKKQASWVFKLDGEIVSYPLDNGQVVYYQPTDQDKVYRRDFEKTEATTSQMTAFTKKLTDQLPYLFALYLLTSLGTLFLGGTLLYLKIRNLPLLRSVEDGPSPSLS